MLSTSILPQYFQKIVYSLPTLGNGVTLVPADSRRTYLRIVTGIAGFGADPGIYLDGDADANRFETLAAATVYEYWWDVHSILVQSQFILRDVTAPGIRSVHGVLCIERQLRRSYDSGTPWKESAFRQNTTFTPAGWRRRGDVYRNPRKSTTARIGNPFSGYNAKRNN